METAEEGRKMLFIFCPFFAVFSKNQGYSVVFWTALPGGEQMKEQNKVFDGHSMADFLPDVAARFCPQCGVAVERNPLGRSKKFCSAACRNQWWNSHQKPEHWSSARIVVCPVCGKEFLSGRELYRPRKYCSRSCANRGRTMKGVGVDG